MGHKFLITSALPYANGPLHIGHIAGAYLPSDIYTRYLKLKGYDVIHICGTDEHGVAITIQAEKERKTPKELVDYYHLNIKNTFERLLIEFDNFSRTTLEIHYKLAQDFFLKLYEKGYLEKRDVKQLFCTNCNRFLPDRYVEGICPHCQFPQARGDQCENCGRWLEPFLLVDPRCTICGSKPIIKESFHYYFKLSLLQEQLSNYLSSKTYWKENVLKLSLQWVKEGLKDRPITRDLQWGVPVPLEEAKNKVLYVWFDAPIGYISGTVEWAEKIGKPDKWKDYWLNPETKLIHFIGKDNIIFHAIVWPAMLIAHGDYILPYHIPANEFLNIMGQKISTSRNYAIWVDELLELFPPDYIRFGLTMILPESKDSDFSPQDFKNFINNELINNYGNFVHRTLSFIQKYMNNNIPKNYSPDNEVISQITSTINEYDELILNFEFKKALKSLLSLSDFSNKYFDFKKPWEKQSQKELDHIIGNCLNLVRALSCLFEPILPQSSSKIKNILNIQIKTFEDLMQPFYPSVDKLPKIEPLFRKIENKTTETIITTLRERIKTIETTPPTKETITISDFQKLDIRIGTILDAQPVENSTKLVKLTIDTGTILQLVAGIRESFPNIKELVGKQVPVLVNLEPKQIRGIVSQGMILVAHDPKTNKYVLITPENKVTNGSQIS